MVARVTLNHLVQVRVLTGQFWTDPFEGRFLFLSGFMIHQDVLVGSMIVALCLLLAFNERTFLERTVKGQRLVRWLGRTRAAWVLRGLAAAGMIFGLLLANGVVRPIKWSSNAIPSLPRIVSVSV